MGTVGTVPACGPNQRGARVSERRRGGSGYGTRNSSGLPDGARSAPLAPGRVRHVRVEIGAAREASRRLGSPPRLARHQSVLDSPSRSGDGSGAPAQSRIANPDVDLSHRFISLAVTRELCVAPTFAASRVFLTSDSTGEKTSSRARWCRVRGRRALHEQPWHAAGHAILCRALRRALSSNPFHVRSPIAKRG